MISREFCIVLSTGITRISRLYRWTGKSTGIKVPTGSAKHLISFTAAVNVIAYFHPRI